MSRKTLLITDQITALQEENEKLSYLKKLLDKAIRNEFGMDTKAIHQTLNNTSETINKSSNEISDFEQQICSYFNLYLTSDKDNFIRIMCTQKSLYYYQKQLQNDRYSDDINDGLSDDNDSFSEHNNYDYTNENE